MQIVACAQEIQVLLFGNSWYFFQIFSIRCSWTLQIWMRPTDMEGRADCVELRSGNLHKHKTCSLVLRTTDQNTSLYSQVLLYYRKLCVLSEAALGYSDKFQSQLVGNGYIFNQGSKSEGPSLVTHLPHFWFTVRNSFIRNFSFQHIVFLLKL